jgi:hypothetical protein
LNFDQTFCFFELIPNLASLLSALDVRLPFAVLLGPKFGYKFPLDLLLAPSFADKLPFKELFEPSFATL